MAKAKFHTRHSPSSLALGDMGDKDGKIFISGVGMFDLSNVSIIGASVDTVRQLYTGIIQPDVLAKFLLTLEGGDLFQSLHPEFDCPWSVGKLPMSSGYRYRLQNNELGVVILFGSYYSDVGVIGSHLKIELSPHFISGKMPGDIQQSLDTIASSILYAGYIHAGCCAHFAVDCQGWDMPDDFQQHFVTHARVLRHHDGITSLQFDDHASISTTYGRNAVETITFGRPNGIQSTLYRKDLQIKVEDKVDYFHAFWENYSNNEFHKDQAVWRVEMRLHHTVVREIGEFLGHPMENYLQMSEYLADIWRYAMLRNRYDYSTSYIHPFWQYLIESADFSVEAQGVAIKRLKKKQDVSAVTHNVAQIVGNVISLAARYNFKAPYVIKQLKAMVFWIDIKNSYALRGMNESDIFQQIEKGLCLRRLIGKAA